MSTLFGWIAHGVAVVGAVPTSLPMPSLEGFALSDMLILLGKTFVIALIGFMKAFAIVKVIARDTGQKLDVNRELTGQGMANIASGLFHGYPVS